MRFVLKTFKISIIVALVVIALDTTFNGFRFHMMLEWQYWGVYFFYSFVITFLNSLFFWQFGEKIGWENASLKKIFLASFGSIVLTLMGFFFCRMIDETVFQGKSFENFLKEESISNYFFPLLFTAIVALTFHLFYFYKALQEKRVKEQKIIAGTASAKFDALKNQLDPHFLFNSLNVLSSLIEENPDLAQKFTGSLSKVYRYVLEQKNKELVSIQEELSFASTYMKLLEIRFENSLFYEPPSTIKTEEAKVVPLSLQLLLENTIKHNIVSEQKPLRIRIYEENGFLVVENNFQKKEVLPGRKGVGLQNIVNRYAILTSREVKIQQTNDYFRVKLPLLTQQISIMETANMNEENAYFKAKQRVKEIKEFYGSLLSFCLVIPFLIYINYRTFWGFQWFWFPLFGWGIGLVFQGVSAFGYGMNWEERKIREIMEKEKQQSKSWK